MLELLHEFEILLTLLYQQFGEGLIGPMKAISFLGTEDFFLLIIPALYWCVSVRIGLNVGVMLLASNAVNMALKLSLHSPRPYWVDGRVNAWSVEKAFGLPSNHAQIAASVWGVAGATIKRAWAIIGAVVIILSIGLSRIYLGMHFTSDVVVGWAVGGMVLMLYVRLEKRLEGWVNRQSLKRLLWAVLLSSLVFLVLINGVRLSLNRWELPAAWEQQAIQSSGEGIDPLHMDTAYTLAGTWMGMLGGAAWLFRAKGGYEPAGSLKQKVLRYLVGLVGVMVLWFGLGQIFPREADFISYFLRFVRYTLVGLWVSAWAPLLFRRLGLAK